MKLTLGKLVGAALVLAVLLVLSGQGKARTKLPPWFVQGALCIHRYEGSWTDPDEPYFGGMQMDRGFQKTYGTWLYRNRGTANHWTPTQQLNISYRAYKGWKDYKARHWTPWPNTARSCGLL